ncbi:MAG: threonylcarbamoyl-AMP synthase [Endomicrobium sp.]|nr:threonylcarbamoyl-AMP synthase [Endomicrobium sp.]
MSKTLRILSKDKKAHIKTSQIIKNGGIAIVPTETVYGFAVDAFNVDAQKKVYKIKGRSQKKPLILMTKNLESAKPIVQIPQKALKIAERFWPGQLTLIFSTTDLGKVISGGRTNIGIRVPNNEFMLKMLEVLNSPVFTTSVNISNKKSAKDIKETLIFDDIVDIIVDGGKCKYSLESTVIDMVQYPYVIIRKGCLDTNEILKYI